MNHSKQSVMASAYFARVLRGSDTASKKYVGHIGRIVHSCLGDECRGFPPLMILEFKNGEREVFHFSALCEAHATDLPFENAKPLRPIARVAAKAPEAPKPLRQPRSKAPEGYCIHGHPGKKAGAACMECDRYRKRETRKAKRGGEGDHGEQA